MTMGSFLFALGAWAAMLPTNVRKRLYQAVKWLGLLALLATLVLPELPSVGINWSGETVALAVATAVASACGHLADRNTLVEPLADTTPAPEPTP